MDYGAAAPKYVDAFQVIRWSVVVALANAHRFAEAGKTA
jgi:hypothetical protein